MLHLRTYANHAGRPQPLPLSFDDAVQRLESLPRMFLELDGSFVWRGASTEPVASGSESSGPSQSCTRALRRAAFQWDGELIDAGPNLECISLKGQGPEALASLEQLFAALQLAPAAVLIEQVMESAWIRADQLFSSQGLDR